MTDPKVMRAEAGSTGVLLIKVVCLKDGVAVLMQWVFTSFDMPKYLASHYTFNQQKQTI